MIIQFFENPIRWEIDPRSWFDRDRASTMKDQSEAWRLINLFKQMVHNPALVESHSSISPRSEDYPLTERNFAFLDKIKQNPSLRKVTAILERYLLCLGKKVERAGILPSALNNVSLEYTTEQNEKLFAVFTRAGLSSAFLMDHPYFLDVARANHWHLLVPFLPRLNFGQENDFKIPVQVSSGSSSFTPMSWPELKNRLIFDSHSSGGLRIKNYRLTERGLVVGFNSDFQKMEPLKKVDSQGKCAIQFLTTCSPKNKLPRLTSVYETGHSMTQVIIPEKGSSRDHNPPSDLYSFGFYPRYIPDLFSGPLQTVQGAYQSIDDDVTRILGGQHKAIVKQYELFDDTPDDFCLVSLLKEENQEMIQAELARQSSNLQWMNREALKGILEKRNRKDIEKALSQLTKMKELLINSDVVSTLNLASKEEKAFQFLEFIEDIQHKFPYDMLLNNCTYQAIRQEDLVCKLLNAKRDQAAPVQVYPPGKQVSIDDIDITLTDRVIEFSTRVGLTFLAATPLGSLLGRGYALGVDESISTRWEAMKQATWVWFEKRSSFTSSAVIQGQR